MAWVLVAVMAGPATAALRAQANRIVEHPCPPRLLNDHKLPFQEAEIACIAFISAALTSDAVEWGALDAVGTLRSLSTAALSSTAMRPFRGTGWLEVGDRKLPKSVLYRGLLAFTLEASARVQDDPAMHPLRDALAQSLVRDLEQGWLESFPGKRYPCDHAPAAAALALHGVRSVESARAADQLVARIEALLQPGYPSQVDARGRSRGPVRATAYGFTAAFLNATHPSAAARFAEALFGRFCRVQSRLALAGCRERAEGPDPKDSAAGPQLAGFSVGATALALLAGIALPSHPMTRALRRSRSLLDGSLNARDHPLASAILAYADHGRPWRSKPSQR
ncbi:MAG: hypothetical protein AAFX94_03815 [Myxococcota bacterium]